MTTFERIKQVANERGFNLKQTALMAGLSENALYRYNQGVEPKYATVKAVADVLGVSVDYLLGNTDEMHVNKKDESTADLIAAHWGIDLDNLSQEEKAIVMARARDYVKGLVDAFESK
ncbi:helix-turn-helix domain-containing protein [Weissella paramesenteroides]|uniref:helix-turn-helix domain-containing protein n=1 Tax=Weissella paramesenteroides TaxID=1249 RepID=UPI0012397BB9|nr:helix-turn-helix transcriptional regulator [Weissella paramesenteroides]KAA8445010.1 helix-turn-helix transcriptional regulator [Weissella paramesenteroides]KAA8452654.1 helix-turn-helix transcriptional regulator [Weissella paramesenteroides]